MLGAEGLLIHWLAQTKAGACIKMPDPRGQCQAVGADHGELP